MMSVFHFKDGEVESHKGDIYIKFGDNVFCLKDAFATCVTVSYGEQDIGYSKDIQGLPDIEAVLKASNAECYPLADMPNIDKTEDMSVRELFEAIKKKLKKRKGKCRGK